MAALSLRGSQLVVRLPTNVAVTTQSRNNSSEVEPRRLNTAAMKRGRGGRSSFSGDVVTVFGGTSFLGRGINNRLGKNGSQIIFPYRGEHYDQMRLKPIGDLGQVLFCPFDLRDEESIRKAVSHSNIVINLIGQGWETHNFSYKDVNVTGPATIARICREMGVQRLVHMSHINAREKPEKAFLPGGSKFLASKWEGEMAVRSEFPGATIFRPSDVYGHGDSFINYWFSRWRKDCVPAIDKEAKSIPLFMKGEYTVKQPVFLSDLATGVMNSLHDPEAVGQTYEALGPQRITQANLLTYMNNLTARFKEDGSLSFSELMVSPVSLAKFWAMEKLGYVSLGNKAVFYGAGLDRVERDSISDESEGLPNLEDLGVKLSSLEQKMPHEVKDLDLYAYYFYETPEEKPVVPPPQLITFAEERALLARRNKLGPLAVLPGI